MDVWPERNAVLQRGRWSAWHRSVQCRADPAWAALLLLLLAAGCSGSYGGRYQVSGQITLDGQPLAGGWIYFRPVGSGPSAAGEVDQGRFQIPARQGLTPGTYRVAIEYLQPTGRQVKAYTGEQVEERKQIIPRRYNEQTELTAKVEAAGANRFTFELQSE